MLVLGLDLSYSSTGLALWDGESVRTIAFETPKRDNLIARAQKVRNFVKKIVRECRPELVAIESPILGAETSEILHGLYYLVMDFLLTKKIPVVSVHNMSLKKVSGVSTKPQMVKAVRRILGPQCKKMVHDEADAFMLAYRVRRFWQEWKMGEEVDLSDAERELFFSEEVTPSGLKKGIVFRRGEFLFLPKGK